MRDLWPGAWFESLAGGDFSATVRRHDFPQMRLEGIDASPYRCQRTSLDVEAHPTETLSINVVMQGALRMREGVTEYQANAGDVFVHRNNAFSFSCPMPTRTFRAVMHSRLLPPILGSNRPLGICPPSALTRAYIRFANEVLASAGGPPDEIVDRSIEESALALHRGLLTSLLQQGGRSSRSREELRVQATDYIEHRLTDPDLDVEQLTQEFQVSRRWLFRAFEDAPESISALIRRRRVEQAKLDLEQNPDIPTHEIGRRNGFNNRDLFTRAFRDHHGRTPAEHRRAFR